MTWPGEDAPVTSDFVRSHVNVPFDFLQNKEPKLDAGTRKQVVSRAHILGLLEAA